MKENAGHDDGLVRELITLFQDDAPKYLERIRAGAAAGNAREIEHGAHALKGSASAVCAARVSAAALDVEHAARAGDMPAVHALVVTLSERLSELDALLAAGGLGRTLALAS